MTLVNVYTQHGRLAPGTGVSPGLGSVPESAGDARLGRLGGLDAERLQMSLAFLAGFRPAVFDAVLDATEPCADDEPDPSREPEPFCISCGAHAGIFWLLGEEWRHYRPGADPNGKPEVYDPGHAPAIGWRTPENASLAAAV